jgi:4-aminobutyrate aminotransferase-like enzyme
LKVLQVIERDGLAANARAVGSYLLAEVARVAEKYPSVVREVRGLGLMIGLELAENIPAFAGSDKSAAIQFVNALHQAGLLAIPAGSKVIRLLPPLILSRAEAAEAASLIESVAGQLSV